MKSLQKRGKTFLHNVKRKSQCWTGVSPTPQHAKMKSVALEKEKIKRIFFNVLSCSFSEKAMAPHSSTLAWKILWTEEPGGLQSMGSLESDTTERLHFHFSLSCIGEENVLAWRIPGTGKPDGLPSLGSHRVGHD